MAYLVTGAAGFIGSAVTEALLRRGALAWGTRRPAPRVHATTHACQPFSSTKRGCWDQGRRSPGSTSSAPSALTRTTGRKRTWPAWALQRRGAGRSPSLPRTRPTGGEPPPPISLLFPSPAAVIVPLLRENSRPDCPRTPAPRSAVESAFEEASRGGAPIAAVAHLGAFSGVSGATPEEFLRHNATSTAVLADVAGAAGCGDARALEAAQSCCDTCDAPGLERGVLSTHSPTVCRLRLPPLRDDRCRSFVLTSSGSVYGDRGPVREGAGGAAGGSEPSPEPFSELHPAAAPLSAYAASKRSAELARAEAAEGPLRPRSEHALCGGWRRRAERTLTRLPRRPAPLCVPLADASRRRRRAPRPPLHRAPRLHVLRPARAPGHGAAALLPRAPRGLPNHADG